MSTKKAGRAGLLVAATLLIGPDVGLRSVGALRTLLRALRPNPRHEDGYHITRTKHLEGSGTGAIPSPS